MSTIFTRNERRGNIVPLRRKPRDEPVILSSSWFRRSFQGLALVNFNPQQADPRQSYGRVRANFARFHHASIQGQWASMAGFLETRGIQATRSLVQRSMDATRRYLAAVPTLASRFGRPVGRSPDFLCLGAQRSGTTSLHLLLSRHPQLFLPGMKEVHYFSLHADRSARWYRNHFKSVAPSRICGEITPYYLYHPEVPRRVRQTIPNVKLIVMLRDPVERAISGYFHAVRRGYESLEIEEAFASEPQRIMGAGGVLRNPAGRHYSHQHHSYAARSRYERQLDRWLEMFPEDRFLLIKYEDFVADKDAALSRIETFLGVSPTDDPGKLPHANRSEGEAGLIQQGLRDRLRNELQTTYDTMRTRFGIEWD